MSIKNKFLVKPTIFTRNFLYNKSRFKTKIQNGFLYVYFAMFIIRFFFRLAYSKALAAPPQEYLT